MNTRQEKIKFLNDIQSGKISFFEQMYSQLSTDELVNGIVKIIKPLIKANNIQNDEYFSEKLSSILDSEGISTSPAFWKLLKVKIFD